MYEWEIFRHEHFNNWFEFLDVMKATRLIDSPLKKIFILRYKCLICSRVMYEFNAKECDHLTCVECTPFGPGYCVNSDCISPFQIFYDISEEEFIRSSPVEYYNAVYIIYNKMLPGIGGILTDFYQRRTY